MDRNELKVQALLEKISNLTAQYENQVADFRVELTMLNQENEQLRTRISELKAPDASETPFENSEPTDDSD